MRLGLEAKVRPQLDERQAEQEASKLRDTFDDALGDLSATLEMEDVLERTSEMQEEVEEMEDSFETIEEAAWRDTGGTFTRGRPGQEPQPQQDGAGLMDTVKEMGMDKLQDKLPDGQGDGEGGDGGGGMMATGGSGIMARAGGLIGGSGGSGGIMSTLSGILAGVGAIGSALLGGAAAVGLVGAGLFALFGIADKLDQHSPLLAQVVGMWDMAMSLMIRPFASLLGRFLLPIATGVLTLAANFNRVFGERGITYALGWLAVNIIHGLGEFFWNIIKWAVKTLIKILLLPIIATVVILKSLLSWFMNSIGPVLSALEPLLWFLLPFIILGMQAFKLLKEGWPRIEKFLSGIYDWAKNSLGGAIGGSLDILEGGAEFSWDIITWTGKISWKAIEWGGKILWSAITWGGKILWGAITWTGKILWNAITWGGKILWSAITWGGRLLWGTITWGGEIAWDAISWGGKVAWDAISWTSDIAWDAIVWSSEIAWDAIVWTGSLDWSDIVWSGTVGLGRWIFDGAVGLGKWIFSGAISLGNWLFEGAIDIADYITGGIGSTVEKTTGWKWTGFASGGIVTGPTQALIGEGRESEAVLPLSRLEQLISTPAQPAPSVGGSLTLDVKGDIGEMDEDSLARSISDALSGHFDNIQTSVEDLHREIRRNDFSGEVRIVTTDGKVIAEVTEDGKDKYLRSREVNK